MLASIGKGKAAAGDEVLHGLGDNDLSRARRAEESCASGDRETAGLPIDDLALAEEPVEPEAMSGSVTSLCSLDFGEQLVDRL